MKPLRYRARRRLALLVLLVGLPTYVMVTATVVGWLGRPDFLVELLIYVGLGVAWVLPLRWIFLGIGRPDPAEAGRDGTDGASNGGV